MEITYRNRNPLEPELEQFTHQVVDDLELDIDEVIIYPSSNNGGVYTGRKDNAPVLGIDHDSRQVLAHELGHDRYSQEMDELWHADLTLDHKGRIDVNNNQNDHIDNIVHEIFADNVARQYVDKEEMFSRAPLEYVKGHLEMFETLVSNRKDESIDAVDTMIAERTGGGEHYFEHPRELEHYEVLGDEITELFESDEEYLTEILCNTWGERIHKCYIRDKEDFIWDAIESFNDFDYGDVAWHQIEDHYGDQVRETIDDNFGRILFNLHSTVQAREAREKIETGEVFMPMLHIMSTSAPSHFSSVIQSGELDQMPTDYDHQVGNFVGSHLYDLGINFQDLEQHQARLEEMGQKSLDLAIEMGKTPDHYNQQDYEQGIEFLAKDIGIL